MRKTHGSHSTIVGALAAATIAAGLLIAPSAATAASPPSQSAPADTWTNMNKTFVTRDGSSLQLDGERFRFNGANAYWLGLDENVGGVDYPTFFRIKNALDTAKEMGLTVVRSHMMTSTSQGNANPLAIMPTIGVYNDDAFKTIDFAIAYAGSIGIRFILPLTDEWAYYHGGHRDFTAPLGLQPDDFYTNRDAISAYQDYVSHILGRTNALTGVRYVDDPTVLAWELGNELEGMTPDWIAEQAAFIKQHAPQQLVAAGRRFDIDPDTLGADDIDIVDVHYYPPTATKVAADAHAIAAAGKVYIAGEYGSPAASAALFDPLVSNQEVTGMMMWSLFPHGDRGGYVAHDDGFTLHYPGETNAARGLVTAIEKYSTALGQQIGTVQLDAPLITQITSDNGLNTVAWRGSAGAVEYVIERSTGEQVWSSVATVGSESSPVLDPVAAGDVAYRITARKGDGSTAVSDAVRIRAGATVVVDPLESLSVATASTGVTIVAGSSGGFARAQAADASLTWRLSGVTSIRVLLSDVDASAVTVSSSADGASWSTAVAETSTRDGFVEVAADALVGEYVRLTVPQGTGVHRATIAGAADRAALIDPLGDFSHVDSRTGSLSIDTGNPAQFGGDAGRAKRDSADPASLTWKFDDISGARFTAWYWPDQPVIPLTVSGSQDGSTFTPLVSTITGGAGNWKQYEYSVLGLDDVNYVRVSWDGAKGEPWTPQIGSMTLYSPNASAPSAPGSFTTTAPADGASGITGTPKLTWASAKDATYYRVVVARDSALTDVVDKSDSTRATSFTPAAKLTAGTRYYWQVTAVNGYGEQTATPAVSSFSLAPLPTAPKVIEDFEGYVDDAALTAAYARNTGGGAVSSTLAKNPVSGSTAALFSYTLTGPGYAGVVRTLPAPQSWWGYEGVSFDAQATAGQTLTVQFVAGGSYWESVLDVTKDGWQTYSIDFSSFTNPPWAGASTLDLTTVAQLAFYRGGTGDGSLLIDDVRTFLAKAPAPANTAPPIITGKAVVGAELAASTGTWDGADLAYAYQWKRDGAAINGATTATYTVRAADAGSRISVTVTARGAGGETSADSAQTTIAYSATLSLSLSPSVVLGSKKVVATVQLVSKAPEITGTSVSVTVGKTTLTAAVDARGVARITLPKMKTGIYLVSAEFTGDQRIAAAKTVRRILVVLF